MITPEELRRLAVLSKLEINEDDTALAEQLERIVAFAGEVCTAAAENEAEDTPTARLSALREDTVLPSFPREEILQNAKNTAEGYFVTKKGGAQ